MAMTTDQRVSDLAELFVQETLKEFGPKAIAANQYLAIIQKAAAAMQQAIEAECEDLRRQWSKGNG